MSHSLSFLRPRTMVLAAAVLFSGLLSLRAERAQVTLLSTTDLHGRILPIDYLADKPAELGLAKLSTLISQVRKENPNTLLIDNGDTIQGTPLVYFHNRKNNTPIDPMMAVMNHLGYASLTLGNHEYNFGLKVLNKAMGEAKFPWLSANTYKVGTDEPAFTPYVVRDLAGVKVGILGLTTPSIPNWENPENYAGLEFREILPEARKWVTILKEKEKVDVVVVSAHMGLEYDLLTGRIPSNDFVGENMAVALCQSGLPIDVLFIGHTHREISSLVIGGVQVVQAGRWGDRLGRVDVVLDRPEGGQWSVIARSARTIPVRAEIKDDPAVVALAKPYHEETQAWLSREIGTCAKTLEATDAHFKDSALIDLVHRAQLEAGEADVSLAANFNPRGRVPAGKVTVRDIAGLYIYENTLYVIEVTGAQLKAALEHAARFFLPYEAGKTPAELMDKSIPLYGYDMAQGVNYEIDLRRPVGDRILNLTFKGEPLAPDRVLRLATNNYRYNGGGGYSMLKGSKVVKRVSVEIRDIIIDWVERHGEIPADPDNNWKLVY